MGFATSFDTLLLQQLDALPHPTWLTIIMTAASVIGRGAAIWVLLAIWLALRWDAAAAWRVVLALLVTYGLVDGVLKPTIGRDRPSAAIAEARLPDRDAPPQSASFPSGHAAAAAAGALSLSRVWRNANAGLWLLALLIASSRLYLGVHYPLDVIAGLAIGWGCAYFVTGGMVPPRTDPRALAPSR